MLALLCCHRLIECRRLLLSQQRGVRHGDKPFALALSCLFVVQAEARARRLVLNDYTLTYHHHTKW
jgi:hypothetical protein